MNKHAASSEVLWIADSSPFPICDVPWVGNTMVFSDGSVYFCCFSDKTIGNVNQKPFSEIWNGEAITGIRQALANQKLPPQCCSNSCPIYRGDEHHYIVQRMRARQRAFADAETRNAENIFSKLEIIFPEENFRVGDKFELEISICGKQDNSYSDLFVGIQDQKGNVYFMPHCDSFAVPFACSVNIGKAEETIHIEEESNDILTSPGTYSVCVAFFSPNSDPNMMFNCYCATTKQFRVDE